MLVRKNCPFALLRPKTIMVTTPYAEEVKRHFLSDAKARAEPVVDIDRKTGSARNLPIRVMR